jgi:DNA-directed RNA polymerase specialized sigma24 family protein
MQKQPEGRDFHNHTADGFSRQERQRIVREVYHLADIVTASPRDEDGEEARARQHLQEILNSLSSRTPR